MSRRESWVYTGEPPRHSAALARYDKARKPTKWLRCLVGTYYGVVREYPLKVAEQLEADGRAQDPDLVWQREPSRGDDP